MGRVLVRRGVGGERGRTESQWNWVSRLLMPEKMMRQRRMSEIRLKMTGMAVRRRLRGRAMVVMGVDGLKE